MILVIVIAIISLAGLWAVSSKAGHPGWACIIPIYGFYTFSIIAFGNASYFIAWIAGNILYLIATTMESVGLIMLSGIVSIALYIILIIKLCKAFEKGIGFIIGMIFLPFIFIPILGFGNSYYAGPKKIFG